MSNVKRQCIVDGCKNRHHSKGYCSVHYQKWFKYGDPLFTHQFYNMSICTVIGCNDKQRANGLCHHHYDISIKPEKNAWKNIKRRCYNPNFKQYKDYGGRGIRMCDEWLNDYDKFHQYVGDRPSKEYSIDRIDNDGNYEPGNVRWATHKEQLLNRRYRDRDKENKYNVTGITSIYDKYNVIKYRVVVRRKHLGYFYSLDDAKKCIARYKKVV